MLKGNLIKIAIVDDDESDYFIITDYIRNIEGANLRVDWLNDYTMALEKIKSSSYHLYFIDYRLGNQTGLQLLDEAMLLGCEEPIVLLTGKGNRSIDIQAMQNGATDYLAKSELNTEKLERCIRYSLERAEVLKELKERENKYRNLFKGSKDAVIITDTRMNITEANYAASLLFETQIADLVNRNLCDFIKSENQQAYIRHCMTEMQNVTDMGIEIVNREAEIKPCLLSVTFQKNTSNKWLVHVILHDITHLKRAELAKLQAEKLAANERLMRIIAHEIRNPLNNISLSVQHSAFITGAPDIKKELVDIIHRNCNRINQSITEMLDLTRTGELDFQKHSLQEIMNESIATVADRINLLNIKLEKRYPDTTLEILADKAKLKIAFSNILVNAIEAMEQNGKDRELIVSINGAPGVFTVSVQDSGIGISEENLSKLFEPFFTLKENGIGLGLAASYSILQSHNAGIRVESKINKGTNFIINFTVSDQLQVSERPLLTADAK